MVNPPRDPVSCSVKETTENATIDSETPMAIPASLVTVNNCAANECTYTVKDGNSTVGGYSYTAGIDLSFDGATEPGSHDYKVSIQRGTENPVTCTGKYTVTYTSSGSGSTEGQQTMNGDNFPQQESISSGTCMSLKGTWSNQYYQAPLVLRCGAGGNITVTYGTKTESNSHSIEFDLGLSTYYTTEEVTFVSNVCVTSDASDLKCGFGNK